jgi:hypothetical protein
MVGSMYALAVTEMFLLAQLPNTHVFNDVEWGSDACSNGGGSFAEDGRCPFETVGWSGSDGGVGFEEPSGECCTRLPVSLIIVRCETPYRGWWGAVVEVFAVDDALCPILFHYSSRSARAWLASIGIARIGLSVASRRSSHFVFMMKIQIGHDGRSTIMS